MNYLNQINIFIDSIFEANIKFNNSLLIDTINSIDKTTTKQVSNVGGWQSSLYTLGQYSHIDNLFNNEISKYVSSVIDKCKFDVINKEIKFNYWININGKYSYNKLHDHAVSLLSGIYYIKVPSNSGDIVFHKDSLDRLTPKTEYNVYNRGSFSYTPKENKLLLFSPYLKHEVTQNLTEDADDKRISLAFNLYL